MNEKAGIRFMTWLPTLTRKLILRLQSRPWSRTWPSGFRPGARCRLNITLTSRCKRESTRPFLPTRTRDSLFRLASEVTDVDSREFCFLGLHEALVRETALNFVNIVAMKKDPVQGPARNKEQKGAPRRSAAYGRNLADHIVCGFLLRTAIILSWTTRHTNLSIENAARCGGQPSTVQLELLSHRRMNIKDIVRLNPSRQICNGFRTVFIVLRKKRLHTDGIEKKP